MKKYIVKEEFYGGYASDKKYIKGQVLYPCTTEKGQGFIKLEDGDGVFACDVGSITYEGHIECIDLDIQDTNHQYGYDYETDIVNLYSNKDKSKSVQEINKERGKVYDEYTNFYKHKLLQLNTIIQNPVPITKEELLEWNRDRKEAMERLNELLVQIESFVYLYHVEEEF